MNCKKICLGIFVMLLIFIPIQYLEAQRITSNSLVGTWELEGVENFPLEAAVSVLELFNDGTGMQTSQIYKIELSERGTLLTFHIDGYNNIGSDRPGKSMYRKR